MKKIIQAVSGLLVLLLLIGCPTPTDPTPDDPVPSSSKGITIFSFTAEVNIALSIDVTGIISGTNIAVAVPYGTDVTDLIATFTTTGSSVVVGSTAQVSGSTFNNFTSSVTYTVAAVDGSTLNYTVTVTIEAASESSGFGSAANPGDTGVLTLSESSKTLTMILANNSSSITFPTGWDDNSTATITTRFWMGETEVTNDVIEAVLQWAYDNNMFSSTVSESNGLDATTVKQGGQQLLNLGNMDSKVDYNGSGIFSTEGGFENHPVVNVTWYGAVMFCNWLTEMRDGNTVNVVYTGIDTTWLEAETVEDVTKTGYRLPSRDEWEYAARYRTDATNTVTGYSDPWFTQGDSASHAVADRDDASATGDVAVYHESSPAPTDDVAVKSLQSNSLGIFDMSGNVIEWCFTKHDYEDYRVARGGGWKTNVGGIYIAEWGGVSPDSNSDTQGFRLSRTTD